MLAKVLTCAVVGLEGELVQVEVDIARQGRSNCTIVGLMNTAVQEAREQVRAAVRNSGLVFPPRRTTVNRAPTELRTSGFPIWPIADDRESSAGGVYMGDGTWHRDHAVGQRWRLSIVPTRVQATSPPRPA